ncbi:hypothetical protein H696_02451 [Fonticula alba]|uniref:Peptidase M28 domain-containing protein n=1 Tax=Fonticula alba TaxID=691883 RepID=A0A058ZDI0_FONAL|nr:hypothetical protein H696_02451 [Fonticula alba]KCV71507.1 hypothetical protein H696_02451 [Fonticula alba]|eukprot:XP_009494630.1 hypothetical protein H696_02451 [Fonticula alba]
MAILRLAGSLLTLGLSLAAGLGSAAPVPVSADIADQRSWYALSTNGASVVGGGFDLEYLVSNTDLRGVYGRDERFALVVDTPSGIDRLMDAGDMKAVRLSDFADAEEAYTDQASPLYDMHVVQCSSPEQFRQLRALTAEIATERQRRADDGLDSYDFAADLVHLSPRYDVLVYRTPAGRPLDARIDPHIYEVMRAGRRTMRIPPRTFKQSPAYNHVKLYSPIIEQAVNSVNTGNLRNVVQHLSEKYHTRHSMSRGAVDAQAYLASRLQSMGLSVSLQQFKEGYSRNVIGELRGAQEPDQIVVIGAHYDSRMNDVNDPLSRAPGADDNASGSSALMELARIFTSNNATYHYTVRFVFFSGEEQGLYGSEAYANSLAAAGENVIAMFNADMLGYRVPGTPITLGMKDRYITEWLLAVAEDIMAVYVPNLPVSRSSSCCSDYRSFYYAGYPAIGFFENPTTASTYPQYHTSDDVMANLDFEQLTMETKAFLATAMTFAVPR